MKKVFKVLAIVILVIVVLLLITPFIFKGKMVDIAEREINKNVNATVDIGGINLTLFRNFPDFSLTVKNLVVTGKEQFDDDTLADISAVVAVVDIVSVLKGDYTVKKVLVDEPGILLLSDVDGNVNWDIAPESGDDSDETVEHKADTLANDGFKFSITEFRINNADIRYKDVKLNEEFIARGFDMDLSGDFTETVFDLNLNAAIDNIGYRSGKDRYTENLRLNFVASINANTATDEYVFAENQLTLNDVTLSFDGMFTLQEEKIGMDLVFQTGETQFKDLLTIIPGFVIKDYEEMIHNGSFTLSGNVKGDFYEDNWPSFQVNLDVDNGLVSYHDMNASLSDIFLNGYVEHPGGDPDYLKLHVSDLSCNLNGNPVKADLLVVFPFSDPLVTAGLKGIFDLEAISALTGYDEYLLKGTIETEVLFEGRMSFVENEKYDEISMNSVLVASDLLIESKDWTMPVEIPAAELSFAPDRIDISGFEMTIGETKLSAKGELRNYLSWYMNNQELEGNLVAESDLLNLNEIMALEVVNDSIIESDDESTPDSVSTYLPDDMDFIISSNISKIIYGKTEIESFKGDVVLRNGELIFDKVESEVFGGQFVMNGKYAERTSQNPVVDINFGLKNLDIQTSYNNIAAMQAYVPVARKTSGNLTSSFIYHSELDNDMMPLLSSLTASGNLLTSKIIIEDIQVFNKLSQMLKVDELKNATIDKADLLFEIIDGKLIVEPFDFKMKDIVGQLSGYTSLDKSINYIMTITLPKSLVSGNLNNMLEGLEGDISKYLNKVQVSDRLAFDVIIEGTITDPRIKVGLKDAMKSTIESIKEVAMEEIEKIKEDAEAKLREEAQQYIALADEQADKIIQEANLRAAQIKSLAGKSAATVIREADSTAVVLVNEGKKNGMIAEIAARKAADKLKEQAQKQSDNIIGEADKKANQVMTEANNKAQKIRSDAREKYENL